MYAARLSNFVCSLARVAAACGGMFPRAAWTASIWWDLAMQIACWRVIGLPTPKAWVAGINDMAANPTPAAAIRSFILDPPAGNPEQFGVRGGVLSRYAAQTGRSAGISGCPQAAPGRPDSPPRPGGRRQLRHRRGRGALAAPARPRPSPRRGRPPRPEAGGRRRRRRRYGPRSRPEA